MRSPLSQTAEQEAAKLQAFLEIPAADPKTAEHNGGIVKATGGGGGRQRGRRFRIALASSMSALTGVMSSARSVLY
jgi:hypothetical protein